MKTETIAYGGFLLMLGTIVLFALRLGYLLATCAE